MSRNYSEIEKLYYIENDIEVKLNTFIEISDSYYKDRQMEYPYVIFGNYDFYRLFSKCLDECYFSVDCPNQLEIDEYKDIFDNLKDDNDKKIFSTYYNLDRGNKLNPPNYRLNTMRFMKDGDKNSVLEMFEKSGFVYDKKINYKTFYDAFINSPIVKLKYNEESNNYLICEIINSKNFIEYLIHNNQEDIEDFIKFNNFSDENLENIKKHKEGLFMSICCSCGYSTCYSAYEYLIYRNNKILPVIFLEYSGTILYIAVKNNNDFSGGYKQMREKIFNQIDVLETVYNESEIIEEAYEYSMMHYYFEKCFYAIKRNDFIKIDKILTSAIEWLKEHNAERSLLLMFNSVLNDIKLSNKNG